MNDDTKKSIAGPLMAKPNSEDRKLSSAAAATPTPTKKVIIKSADMLPDMQKEAVDIAVNAFEKHNIEKDVAEHIKKEFDKRHGPTWHCIVGRNFADEKTAEEMIPGVCFHFESDVHPSGWRTLSQKLAIEVRM